jgi:hypothetical protein
MATTTNQQALAAALELVQQARDILHRQVHGLDAETREARGALASVAKELETLVP